MKTTNTAKKLNAFDRMLHRLVDKFMANQDGIRNYCLWTALISDLVILFLAGGIYGACWFTPLEMWVNVVGICAVAGFASVFIVGLFRPLVMLYGAITGK